MLERKIIAWSDVPRRGDRDGDWVVGSRLLPGRVHGDFQCHMRRVAKLFFLSFSLYPPPLSLLCVTMPVLSVGILISYESDDKSLPPASGTLKKTSRW